MYGHILDKRQKQHMMRAVLMVAICAMCFSCEIYSYLFGFSVCIFCCLLFPQSVHWFSKTSQVYLTKRFIDLMTMHHKREPCTNLQEWVEIYSEVLFLIFVPLRFHDLLYKYPWRNHTVKDVKTEKCWVIFWVNWW